jgi:hypothetical protein
VTARKLVDGATVLIVSFIMSSTLVYLAGAESLDVPTFQSPTSTQGPSPTPGPTIPSSDLGTYNVANWPRQVDLWIGAPITQVMQYRSVEAIGTNVRNVFYDCSSPITNVLALEIRGLWNGRSFYTNTISSTIAPGARVVGVIELKEPFYPVIKVGLLAQTGTITSSLSFVGQSRCACLPCVYLPIIMKGSS